MEKMYFVYCKPNSKDNAQMNKEQIILKQHLNGKYWFGVLLIDFFIV